MEKVIYMSGVNTFYELDDGYKLVNQKGNFAILDKNIKLLLKIAELLQGERSFYFNDKTRMFYLNIYEDGVGKFYCSLRQLVVAISMDGDFEENLNMVKNNTVLLVNDAEYWNLKRSNLEFTGADNNINTFFDDGKYFYVRHIKTGYTVRTDLDHNLNELLKQYRWGYSEGCKTLGAFLNNNQSNFIPIHRFVRIYYDRYNDDMDIDLWNNVMKRVSKKAELNVDHLDSDRSNCCQENLTWMKFRDNTRKGNLTKKLNQKPFRCEIKASEYGLRMEAGYNANNMNLKITTNYKYVPDFVDAVREFWDHGILHDDAGREYKLPEIPKNYYKGKTQEET